MRASILLAAFAVTAWTFAGAAIAQQSDASASTVKEVMTTMTIPSSDQIFELASDPPATDEGWAKVKRAALTLAESGRLLTTPKLAKDGDAWMEMARELVKEAERASQAADTKDAKALEEGSDTLYTACKTCHSRYMADSVQ